MRIVLIRRLDVWSAVLFRFGLRPKGWFPKRSTARGQALNIGQGLPRGGTQAGLGAAVESLAARSPVDVTVEMPAGRYAPAVESTGYFVVSEALTNVAKYAHASHAAVRGSWREDVLTIEVTDDGIGGADPATGTGLRGLVDRLSVINGTLEVTSPTGAGTWVEARIPTGATLTA